MCGAWVAWWTVSVLVGAVVVGDDGARLQRHAGVAAGDEGRLDHLVAAAKAGRRRRSRRAGEDQVVAELGMDHRRAGVERGLHVDLRGQLLPLDSTSARRRPRPRRGCRATTATTASPCQQSRGRAAAGAAAPTSCPSGARAPRPRASQTLARSAPVKTRSRPAPSAPRRIDRDDARMRVRAAQEGGMRHARQHDVVGVGRAALHQLAARSAAARSGRCRSSAGPRATGRWRPGVISFIARPPGERRRRFSVVSTASTIAW
jgi:hypothetical protein